MLYYDDSYATECRTVVTGILDEAGRKYLVLRDNLFYPQGGGKKGDRGTLEWEGGTVRVLKALRGPDGPVLATDAEDPALLVGKTVHCSLDWAFRLHQMRLHSALHLLHSLIGDALGREPANPSLSEVEEGFAVNRYPASDVDPVDFSEIERRMNEIIAKGEPASVTPDPKNPGFRVWRAIGHEIPCGGLHVRDLSEIGPVSLVLHRKKGNVSVKVFLESESGSEH